MIGDEETSEEHDRRFIKHNLEVAVVFKKLRISPIITYQFRVEVCTEIYWLMYQTLFSLPNIEEKKWSGYARLVMVGTHQFYPPWPVYVQASEN